MPILSRRSPHTIAAEAGGTRLGAPPRDPAGAVQRMRAALAAAKARGKRLGGFRGRAGTAADCAKARRAKSLAAKSRAADLAPVIEDIRTAGANSLRSIAKELNERGISAPRGGIWSASQVRAAMARIATSLAAS